MLKSSVCMLIMGLYCLMSIVPLIIYVQFCLKSKLKSRYQVKPENPWYFLSVFIYRYIIAKHIYIYIYIYYGKQGIYIYIYTCFPIILKLYADVWLVGMDSCDVFRALFAVVFVTIELYVSRLILTRTHSLLFFQMLCVITSTVIICIGYNLRC